MPRTTCVASAVQEMPNPKVGVMVAMPCRYEVFGTSLTVFDNEEEANKLFLVLSAASQVTP